MDCSINAQIDEIFDETDPKRQLALSRQLRAELLGTLEFETKACPKMEGLAQAKGHLRKIK